MEIRTIHWHPQHSFGMLQVGRNFNSPEYKYSFNGKLKDDELKGSGNSYDFGDRIFDSRICRFFSRDKLFASFADLTPYQFAANTPIQAIDLDGLESWPVKRKWAASDIAGFQKFVESELKVVTDESVKEDGTTAAEKFDCADLAIALLIRYAAQEGLEVEFHGADGTTIFNSSTKEFILTIDGKEKTFTPTTPEEFESLVRGYANATSILKDMYNISNEEPLQAGDLTNNGVHVQVVIPPDPNTQYSEGITPVAYGSGSGGEGIVPKTTIVATSEFVFKRWNVLKGLKETAAPPNNGVNFPIQFETLPVDKLCVAPSTIPLENKNGNGNAGATRSSGG